jgi:hypothetical protein
MCDLLKVVLVDTSVTTEKLVKIHTIEYNSIAW